MLAVERDGIYARYGIDGTSPRSLRPLDAHPVRDWVNSTGEKLANFFKEAVKHPLTSALASCVLITGAAEAAGISILPPFQRTVSLQPNALDSVVSFENQNPQDQVGIDPYPISEPISKLARVLLMDEDLTKFARALPKGSSATLETFDQAADGIVQPKEGMYVRELPSVNAKLEYPYGLDNRQGFKYQGKVIIDIPQTDGTIRHEEWIVLSEDVAEASDRRRLFADKPVFVAKEIYSQEANGKIIPGPSMNLFVAGANEPKKEKMQTYKLQPYKSDNS